MPPTSSPVPRLSSVLSAVLTVRTIASRSCSHQIAPAHKEGKSGQAAETLGDVIATTSPPINQPGQRAGRRSVCHPAASRLRPAACCFFLSSSFSSLRPDLFRSLLPDVLPAILPASSPLPGGEGMCRAPARAGDPLPLILPTLSTPSGASAYWRTPRR